MIDEVEHNGRRYYRINPADVDLEKMTEVQKVTNIFAYQLEDGNSIVVETKSGGILETINTAYGGDWVVYNIGNATGDTLKEKLKTADIKVIHDEAFKKLYAPKEESDFSDYDDTIDGREFRYIGKPVQVARVPFNFVIRATWGSEQFVEKGGFIVYNTNTSTPEKHDIYGTAGAKNRKAGQFQNTYTKVDDNDERLIKDVYKFVIMADRSPISGIQFNSNDIQEAYERIGKDGHELER